MRTRIAAASFVVFVVTPALVIFGNAVTIAVLGQVFFFCWFIPFLYCIVKSV